MTKCVYIARNEMCHEKWVGFTPLTKEEVEELHNAQLRQAGVLVQREKEEEFVNAEVPISELDDSPNGTFLDTEGLYEGSSTRSGRILNTKIADSQERERAIERTRLRAEHGRNYGGSIIVPRAEFPRAEFPRPSGLQASAMSGWAVMHQQHYEAERIAEMRRRMEHSRAEMEMRSYEEEQRRTQERHQRWGYESGYNFGFGGSPNIQEIKKTKKQPISTQSRPHGSRRFFGDY